MAKLYTVVLKDLEAPPTRVSAQVTLTNFVTNKEEKWREADFTHPRTGRKTRARKEAASTAWFETYDIELFTHYHNLEIQAKKQKDRMHTGNQDEDANNWCVYAEADAYDSVVTALLSPNPLTVLRRKMERATEERDIYQPEEEGYRHHQHVLTLCETVLAECEMVSPLGEEMRTA